MPKNDAPVNNAGDISLTYFDDDLAKTITQNGVTTTFELDALARRTTSTITNNPTVTRHYGDDSDNPAWTTNSDGMTMRNMGSLDGSGAIIFGDGSAALTIGNPHGDNVTTVILPVGHAETTAAVSISEWADYDEYGITKSNYPQGVTYGWLGKHERSASIESAGLTLMGVRLYNPTRGAFTSVDPIPGGNSTAYTYPQDPVNDYDLNGQACLKCKLVTGIAFGLRVVLEKAACKTAGIGFMLCAGLVRGLVNSVAYLTTNLWAKGKKFTQSMAGKAIVIAVVGFLEGVTIGASRGLKALPTNTKRGMRALIGRLAIRSVNWLRSRGYADVASVLMRVSSGMTRKLLG